MFKSNNSSYLIVPKLGVIYLVMFIFHLRSYRPALQQVPVFHPQVPVFRVQVPIAQVPFAVARVPFAVARVPLAVARAPFAVARVPLSTARVQPARPARQIARNVGGYDFTVPGVFSNGVYRPGFSVHRARNGAETITLPSYRTASGVNLDQLVYGSQLGFDNPYAYNLGLGQLPYYQQQRFNRTFS